MIIFNCLSQERPYTTFKKKYDEAIKAGQDPLVSLRISFSKFNTIEDLEYFFECLHDILKTVLVNA